MSEAKVTYSQVGKHIVATIDGKGYRLRRPFNTQAEAQAWVVEFLRGMKDA